MHEENTTIDYIIITVKPNCESANEIGFEMSVGVDGQKCRSQITIPRTVMVSDFDNIFDYMRSKIKNIILEKGA